MKPLKKLKTEIVIDDKYVKILADTIELPNGKKKLWYRQDKPDVVMMCPIMKDGKVLVQKNYRYGVDAEMIQFAAGWVDEGGSPLEAAKRELMEETGYSSEKWTLIGKGIGNPNWSKSMIWFFVAEECEKTSEQHLEGTEQIEPFLVENIEKAKSLIQNQEIPDATGMALFSYLPKEILTRYA